MTYNEALEKAAKLLRLANSSNPHEAALAASRAQEIMDRYKLTSDAVAGVGGDIRSDEPIRQFDADPLEKGNRLDRWKGQLAMALCEVNQAKVYKGHQGLILIGRASDVMTVRYLYAYVTRQVEALAARDCSGMSRTFWNNFRVGCVETVSRRLREQMRATVATVRQEATAALVGAREEWNTTGDAMAADVAGAERALMVVNRNAELMVKRAADVEAWTKKNLKLRNGGGYRTGYSESGRQAGRRAGGEIRLTGGHAALNSSRQALR